MMSHPIPKWVGLMTITPRMTMMTTSMTTVTIMMSLMSLMTIKLVKKKIMRLAARQVAKD
jgi:hypothetical protein